MSLYKVHTKCAKLVDEKKNRLFCCASVRDFEPKILIKLKKTVGQKVYFLLRKKCIHIMNPKSSKKYMSPYYFWFYIQYK